MYKLTSSYWLLAFCLLSLPTLHSQTASFATWKDNKKAAYTIVHDDFGSYVTGIYDHAYPIATARGIKFSFGAITSACDVLEWTKARTMIAAGHECINHSHSHKCGGFPSDCTGSLTYGPADFPTELDLSTQLIQTNTGIRPLFFIHPYDAFTPTVINYLKNNLGYIGSRAGVGSLNTSNFTNYMNINFYGFDNSANAIAGLNPSVDDVIASGGYLMREFHGIADPSFASMTIATYTNHLNYVKTKIDNGSIWSATASEAITYRMQRDAYTIATVYNATAGTINVNFTNTATLDTLKLRTPITVNVDLGAIIGNFTALQGLGNIIATRKGTVVSFNVYPHRGNVVLRASTAQPANILNLSAKPQTAAVALTWTNPTTNFGEVMIVAKPLTGFTTQPVGTAYVANTNFSGASTAFEGGKVVYRGTGTNALITGLADGTLYYFKAFTLLGTVWSSGVEVSATTPGVVVINPVLGCLKGTYFSNATLSGTPVVTRGESSINYDWLTGAPITGLPVDQFSVRWEGIVIPPLTGAYTFTATADDGVRLWVNNVLVINKWLDQAATAYTATVNLTQGQPTTILMEYYENGGNASAKLEWTIPTQAKRVIAFDACPVGSVFNPTLCYRLLARHSNKAMSLTSSSTATGVAVVQNTWLGTRDQVWRIKQVAATDYQLVNGLSGLSATVQNASLLDLAPIVQSTYLATTNQQFNFDQNTEGYYKITAKHSAKVMDVTGDFTADQTPIIQYNSNLGTNQQWKIESIGCPVGTAALAVNRVVTFNGYLDDNKGILQWVVNSDDLKDYYDVEKMDDTQNFKRLTTINGNSSDALRSFSFTDDNLEEGENLYRLKSVDKDGSVQMSDVINIKSKHAGIYALSPNPTSDYLDVNLEACESRAVVLTVVDASGHEIKVVSLEKAAKTHRIELGDLASGQYLLHIKAVGKRPNTRLFIVSK